MAELESKLEFRAELKRGVHRGVGAADTRWTRDAPCVYTRAGARPPLSCIAACLCATDLKPAGRSASVYAGHMARALSKSEFMKSVCCWMRLHVLSLLCTARAPTGKGVSARDAGVAATRHATHRRTGPGPCPHRTCAAAAGRRRRRVSVGGAQQHSCRAGGSAPALLASPRPCAPVPEQGAHERPARLGVILRHRLRRLEVLVAHRLRLVLRDLAKLLQDDGLALDGCGDVAQVALDERLLERGRLQPPVVCARGRASAACGECSSARQRGRACASGVRRVQRDTTAPGSMRAPGHTCMPTCARERARQSGNRAHDAQAQLHARSLCKDSARWPQSSDPPARGKRAGGIRAMCHAATGDPLAQPRHAPWRPSPRG